jgi:predicted amidophosphoribosyltransferase
MPATRSRPGPGRTCCGCGTPHRAEPDGLRSWCTHCRDRWGVVPGWWQPEPGGVPGWAAAAYAGPVRRAVLAAKRGAGEGLCELLVARLPIDCLPRDAVISWIPAHPRRALLAPDAGAQIARALATREGLPRARLLRRSPLGHRQAHRDRDERRDQGRQLGLHLRGRGPAPAAVVLVDDVRTTGATLDEAARVLREAGTRHVIGVAVAHAGAA